MASWMVHLRVADMLLDRLPNIFPREFVFGNIAPDSGVPNKEYTVYSPPKKVSHFSVRENGHTHAGYREYADIYLSKDRVSSYSREEHSFHLGYFSHLLTDFLWSINIIYPLMVNDAESYAKDKTAAIWKWKEDWYDLDFRYLRDHPDFRAYKIFLVSDGLENRFLDFFSRDAFSLSQKRITDFYSAPRQNLDRVYLWLTQENADRFVSDTADAVFSEIKKLSRI